MGESFQKEKHFLTPLKRLLGSAIFAPPPLPSVTLSSKEDEVLGRIKASLDDPLGLEQAGYALYDMYTERRGNLFGQEVYRLVKATDATTTYATISTTDATAEPSGGLLLPSNHKFSNNDVIVLTEQPNGSGDFFTTASSPVSENSVCAEAVVLNIGPTYVDVSMAAGCFEATFGLPGNDMSGQGNKNLRLRADQFVSNVPYQRMVSALSQITAVPENKRSEPTNQASSATPSEAQGQSQKYAITMDDVIKEVILKTHVFFDPNSPLYGNSDFCNVEELVNHERIIVFSNDEKLSLTNFLVLLPVLKIYFTAV